MKASDLRIGNWVKRKDSPIEATVMSIQRQVFGTTQGVLPIHNIEPIPLTEEWLIKFGFEKYTEDWYGKDRLFVNRLDGVTYMSHYRNIHDHMNIGVFITYIHQLQNLYFSLTGEELKITE